MNIQIPTKSSEFAYSIPQTPPYQQSSEKSSDELPKEQKEQPTLSTKKEINTPIPMKKVTIPIEKQAIEKQVIPMEKKQDTNEVSKKGLSYLSTTNYYEYNQFWMKEQVVEFGYCEKCEKPVKVWGWRDSNFVFIGSKCWMLFWKQKVEMGEQYEIYDS